MDMRLRLVFVVLATECVARAVSAQPFALDHFNLYDAVSPPPPVPSVTLTDQFGTSTTALTDAIYFLVPADKNDEGIQDPFGHLTCYGIADPGPPGPSVVATHQFGSTLLTLGDPQVLCVNTDKLIDTGASVTLDHYQCYGANGPVLGASVGIADQFQTQTLTLATPFLFCNPVDKNSEGIQNPDDHLVCYDYTPPGQSVGTIPIANQFFPDSTDIDVSGSHALCLPAAKEVVTTLLDHYTLYRATGPDGPIVAIVDQFGQESADLGVVDHFLVPAQKNGEPLIDPISHLTCHAMDGGLLPPPRVIVGNQLGDQVLDVGSPLDFCVPTEKLLTPGPVSIDHFKCYAATGPPADVPVTWGDQFQASSALLLDPFLLCNPAEKNGEGGVSNPDDHLVCYRMDPPGGPVGLVPIANQFFPFNEIDVQDPYALCLPSSKRIPDPVDHFAVYRATGPDAPTVTLTDQFGTQTTDLGGVDQFWVPADKNGEGIADAISHLTCHAITEGSDPLREVHVSNQFGDQILGVSDPRQLCLPTEKAITPGTVSIDHFKCYDANGIAPDVPIDWTDQFQGAGVQIGKPFLHCNPVDKNGEGIQNPVDHLVCYDTAPPGTPVGLIDVTTQFNTGPIDVDLPFAFCAPSEKTFVPEPERWLGLVGCLLLLAPLKLRRGGRG